MVEIFQFNEAWDTIKLKLPTAYHLFAYCQSSVTFDKVGHIW